MDQFDVKAIKKEREFFKKIKADSYFLTGKGKKNFIEKVTPTAIFVRTKKSKVAFKITRKRLREAIKLMFYKRTATRKELEGYCKYNSALMGLLRLIFISIAKFKTTVKGLLRLILRGNRHFLSGVARAPGDMELATDHNHHFFLMSYFHIRDDTNENWLYHARRLNAKILIDSGAYSVYAAQLKGEKVEPISVEDYAAFILKHQKRSVYFGCLNLDVIGDNKQTRKNAQYLRERGVKGLIEVWHPQSDDWAELWRMVHKEDHPVIAIGGTAFLNEKKKVELFDELYTRFPNQPFHILGGASQTLYQYEWFSSDSTSWLNARKYRTLITPHGHVEAPEDWSTKECLVFNVEQLNKLEDNYDGNHQIDLLIPPKLKNLQLALF
ncbi:hypothetical protein J2S74_002919 [Evansella vedderi]|uniref:Uncharacterized protein n=1 Tax=Evansella vedderi TaxID=38282 RepID=A0ABT9ZXS3_9BACI|nr:hypothetical protein [Evansella vedderi]MDQ0255537.1 hypothetical protein [Evansella vedderi]